MSFQIADIVRHRTSPRKGLGKIIAIRPCRFALGNEYRVIFLGCSAWFIPEELVKVDDRLTDEQEEYYRSIEARLLSWDKPSVSQEV